jgi:hypothetical protein
MMATLNAQRLTAYEYWLDEAIQNRTLERRDSVVQDINLISLIPISNLSNGFHAFNIRFKNDSLWSHVERHPFYKVAANAQIIISEWKENQKLNLEFAKDALFFVKSLTFA